MILKIGICKGEMQMRFQDRVPQAGMQLVFLKAVRGEPLTVEQRTALAETLTHFRIKQQHIALAALREIPNPKRARKLLKSSTAISGSFPRYSCRPCE
jgi:hypothetical protein